MTPRAKPITHALSVVAERFNITVDDLKRDDRVEPLQSIRRMAMTVSRHATGRTYTEIAATLARDHSSVHNACHRHRAYCNRNEWLRKVTAELILMAVEGIGGNPPLYRVGALPSVQLSDMPDFDRSWKTRPQKSSRAADLPSGQRPTVDGVSLPLSGGETLSNAR